ncbi:MAG: NAD(P) transhydrogenase subunit alpha [Alphaproteobacteria bacterium]
MDFHGLTIGIPTEIMPGERRVAATPETVGRMVSEKARMLVQAGAGKGSFFADDAYLGAGAQIVSGADELFEKADIVLKVKEPRFNEQRGVHEIDMMHDGQYFVTFLHPASPRNHEMVKALAARGVVSFTLDGVPRIARAQQMDALTSMSMVAGYKAVLIAANHLTKFVPMVGTAVGPIAPARALVAGMGVAGLRAAATGKQLGAVVSAVDIRPEACEQSKSLGAKVIETGVPAELAVGEGGYAKRLPDEWLVKERDAIRDAVAQADFVILTALIPGKVAPILVTEEMVQSMKAGTVIVDVAIDQGGNCAVTQPGETVEKHGVTIAGIANIPGMVPGSSTWLFAKNVYNYLANLVRDGQVRLDTDDEIIRASIVTRNGAVVHAGALEAMSAG